MWDWSEERNDLERSTKEHDSCVLELQSALAESWVARDTRNPVWISRDHPVRLNTPERPIVNQYREGKVKRTPHRGVKKTLKPFAYKRSEHRKMWRRAFCIMILRVSVSGKVKWFSYEAEAKASPNRALSQVRKTRNQVIYPCPGWRWGNTQWRTEPVSVEKLSDEVRVGAKDQSNLEIARTPRNAFRGSVLEEIQRGRATDWMRGLHRLSSPDELRMRWIALEQWGRGC